MDITNMLENKDLFNRLFINTSFHKTFLDWVNKDPVLSPWNIEYLIANFLDTYSDQETIDEFHDIMRPYLGRDEHGKQPNKFFLNVKKELGKLLYKQLEPYACHKNSNEYELTFELQGVKFVFSFLYGLISSLDDDRFYTSYNFRFKAIQHMFCKETIVTVKKNNNSITLEIDYDKSLKDSYTLIREDISCPFCNKDHNGQNRFCSHNCGTVYCYCGNEYHTINDIPVRRHNPNCGEDSDVDSVKEYRDATELHREEQKKISEFYARKNIFRCKFNSDDIITKMSLPEDVKERIFAKFDDFSDRFTDKYGGQKSFLPYQYIFFRLLLEEGYQYPHTCPEPKLKAIEELYWSVKDPKDYNNFINYLRSIYSKNFEIYDTEQKVVIQKSLSRSNNQVYVLSINGDTDLVLQYFTKVLLKSGIRPEDRYNLFILEMEAKSQTISLENITDYIFSYVIYELVYYAEEL